jgi:hypothetical protein
MRKFMSGEVVSTTFNQKVLGSNIDMLTKYLNFGGVLQYFLDARPVPR